MLAQLDGPADYEVGKGGLKKILKKVAKVGAAPARIAFLGLVRINMFHLATHLATAWKNHKDEVVKFWTGIGGSPADLLKFINLGGKAHLTGKKHQAHKAARHARHDKKKTDRHTRHDTKAADRHTRHEAHRAERHARHDAKHAPDGSAEDGSQGPDDNNTIDIDHEELPADHQQASAENSQQELADQDTGADTDTGADDSEESAEEMSGPMPMDLTETGRDHLDVWAEMIHPHGSLENKSALTQNLVSHIRNIQESHRPGRIMGVIATATIVAATPVLVAALAMLKRLKIVPEDHANRMEAAVELGAEAMGQNPAAFPMSEQQITLTPNGLYAKAGIIPGVEGPLISTNPVLILGIAAAGITIAALASEK